MTIDNKQPTQGLDQVVFYRFHPVTGADANIFDMVGWTAEQKQEMAAMVRCGARFYWKKEGQARRGDPGCYTRVEKRNASFALTVAGIPHRFVDHDTDGLKPG